MSLRPTTAPKAESERLQTLWALNLAKRRARVGEFVEMNLDAPDEPGGSKLVAR